MHRGSIIYSRQQIAEAVERLAAELRHDYEGKHPLLISILKGSFVFMADLIRAVNMPLEVEFVKLSSYGRSTETSGRVLMVSGLTTPLRGRHVVVVEDIVDSGVTLGFFLERLRRQRPASVATCVLFDKPSRRQVPVHLDYIGLTVPDVFIVGYGIDYAEDYRYLPELWGLEEDK